MAQKSHDPPDDRNPWPELGDLLRDSVKRIRQVPPPQDALDRVLARAAKLGPPRRRPWLIRNAPLLAAVAASLMLGVGLRYGPYPLAGSRPPTGRVAAAPNDRDVTIDLPPKGLPRTDARASLLLTPGRAAPGEDNMTIGIGQVAGNWGSWEQVQSMRDLTVGMPTVDRKGVEAYLRHQSRPGRNVSWNRDARPLRQPRILQGDGERELQLQGMNVQARLEGPRARTLVDLIFANPDDKPMVGTFEMALPDGSSPSYFAFFPGNSAEPEPVSAPAMVTRPGGVDRVALPTPEVAIKQVPTSCWGQPKVGCVVPVPGTREAAYHPEGVAGTESSRSQHPSLRGLIGTIQPKAKIRVMVAYEETLPIQAGRMVYRFALPQTKLYELSVTVQADAAVAGTPTFEPEDGVVETSNGLVTIRRTWKNVQPEEAVVFRAAPPDLAVQATSGKGGDGRYLLARLRPDVPTAPAEEPFARHAVFLLDTSAGESEARFDRSVKLMRRILESDESIRHFNVLTFSTGAAWLSPGGWMRNTKEGRETALSRLDGIVLEGATDLSAAVDKLFAPGFEMPPNLTAQCFLLSEGRLSCGETDLATLAARLEARGGGRLRWHCYHLGLGEENAELFGLLTRAGGGVYRCLSEAEVTAAARAHLRPCLVIDRVTFEGGPDANDVLVAGRRAAVYPGGDLVVAGRFTGVGETTIVVEGRVAGKRLTQRFPVAVKDSGELAGRGWGELAVSSILALNDPRLEPVALAIARQFRVPSRVSAFGLSADPARWEAEEAPPFPRDLGVFLDGAWESLGLEVTARQRRNWLAAQLNYWMPVDVVRRDLWRLVQQLPSRELTLPASRLQGGLTRRAGADATYLEARRGDRRAIEPLLAEADRRAKLGQADAAARVLCGLIEEHPGNAEVARLVAYHLIAMRQPALAAQVMAEQVDVQPLDAAAHRALAVALDEAGSPGRAALHFEIALTLVGSGGSSAAAVREEFIYLLRRWSRNDQVPDELRLRFRDQLSRMVRSQQPPLQVSVTWNKTTSNVALSVIGTNCKVVRAPEAEAGMVGVRAGPRRVTLPKDERCSIEVELTHSSSESLETFVSVQAVRDGGLPTERVETKRVLLRKVGEKAKVD